MGKVWVLDTETKGTGAHMVPLEQVLVKPAPKPELALVRSKRPPKRDEPAEQPEPKRFKVVDVMSGQVLGEGVDARAAVRLLGGMRSVVDARIYVWEQRPSTWRLLTLREQKAIWARRDI
jgi:hypothetical protein